MHRPMKRERLRADPLVSISSIFEKILTDLRTALVNDIDIFMKPVDKKTVADYYDVIQNPISIQERKKSNVLLEMAREIMRRRKPANRKPDF